MNDFDSEQVLKLMAATWPGELTEDRIAVWTDTLADVRPGHAREAIRNLKRVKTFLPSHAEFFEAVEAIIHREATQQEEIEAGATGGTLCPDCDGNLWIEVDRVGQGHVVRCERCNPAPKTKNPDGTAVEHKSGCTCMICHYGPKRAALIRVGRDGLGPRRKVENEDLPPPPPDERYEKQEAAF